MEGVTDAETTEVLAYREGLNLASDQKIRIASDCANVITNIQDDGMGQYDQVVRGIRQAGVLWWWTSPMRVEAQI